ncbi:hypothetical protein ACERII_19505 [Evansella sp. AB-rgal1]|uniref:hypothetical protein n=1 Tax=Evansella sp. AB-rgal1 TaxID=3242696 RepID=UPI00359D8A22
MRFVLNLISIISFSPFITDVTEEQIGENIKLLKKHQWFQNYLSNEEYRRLIIKDKDVREVIGRFNNKKMDNDSYHTKFQKKLHNVLIKRSKSMN